MAHDTHIRISARSKTYSVYLGSRRLAEHHGIEADGSLSWSGQAAADQIKALAEWVTPFDMAIINLIMCNLQQVEDLYHHVAQDSSGDFERYEDLWLVISHLD